MSWFFVFRQISPDVLDRISQSVAPYESALRADDRSVPYFPICQGMLPSQPNNVAKMKANRYYVHSLHVCQISARFVLLRLATNATISCKILVKIVLVVLENSLTNRTFVAR